MTSPSLQGDSNVEEARVVASTSSVAALWLRLKKVEVPSIPFSDLPDDCIVHLCAHFLAPIHIGNLAATCRRNMFVLENNFIWRQQVERDHGLHWRDWMNGSLLRDGSSVTITEEEMQNPGQYKKIYKHLEKYRNILEADESDPPGERDAVVKILMVGNSGVGKTSLLRRFSHDDFLDAHSSTIGVDFHIKPVQTTSEIPKKWHVRLQIWDTGSREKFMPITRAYYRGSNVVLITFNLTDRGSFQSVKNWHAETEKNATSGFGTVMCLVGTKSDLIEERQVSESEARELARELHIPYFETSAKSGTGVQLAFLTASSMAFRRIVRRIEEHAVLAAKNQAPASQSWISAVFSRIERLFK